MRRRCVKVQVASPASLPSSSTADSASPQRNTSRRPSSLGVDDTKIIEVAGLGRGYQRSMAAHHHPAGGASGDLVTEMLDATGLRLCRIRITEPTRESFRVRIKAPQSVDATRSVRSTSRWE